MGQGGIHSQALLVVLLQHFFRHILHKVRPGDFLRDRHSDEEGAEELNNTLVRPDGVLGSELWEFTWKEKR